MDDVRTELLHFDFILQHALCAEKTFEVMFVVPDGEELWTPWVMYFVQEGEGKVRGNSEVGDEHN